MGLNMKRVIGHLIIASFLFMQVSCRDTTSEIDTIAIMFPMGGTDLRVRKNGEARLYYNTSVRHSIIKKGIFNTEQLYKYIKLYLHPTVPGEDWPDPKAKAGMVQIKYTNKNEESFLIFNPQEWTSKLFNKARTNILSEVPI